MAGVTREGAGGSSQLAPVRSVKSPTAWQVLYTIQGDASGGPNQRGAESHISIDKVTSQDVQINVQVGDESGGAK